MPHVHYRIGVERQGSWLSVNVILIIAYHMPSPQAARRGLFQRIHLNALTG